MGIEIKEIFKIISYLSRKSRLIKFICNIGLNFINFYIQNFNRRYLKASLLARKEKVGVTCESCGGYCCKENGCKAWNKETGKCNIWKYADY